MYKYGTIKIFHNTQIKMLNSYKCIKLIIVIGKLKADQIWVEI